MAVNKNFVVKNGIEVATDLIFASSDLDKVGIGSTIPTKLLEVGGDSKLTGNTTLVGVTTVQDTFEVGTGGTVVTADVQSGRIGLNTATPEHNVHISNVGTGDTTLFVDGGDLKVDGNIYADNLSGITDINAVNLNITGIATLGDGTGADLVDINADVDMDANLHLTGIATVTGLIDANGGIRIGTGGTVGPASGGIVTYYGDGSQLTNITATSGGTLGFSTAGAVGYGVTLLNFIGAGTSTISVPHSGIATLTIVGGGGGGSANIGIGTTVGDAFSGIITSGNLWYNTNEARLFIYYFDGSSSQWVDAAPFNIGIITSGLRSLSQGTALSPSLAFSGDSSTGLFSPATGKQTFVSVGSSILNINPGGVEVTGVVTATSYVGDGSSLTGVGIGTQGSVNTSGIITATTFSGNASSATYATSAGIASTATAAATAYGLTGSPNITVGDITGTGATFSNNLNVGTAITMYSSTGIISATKYYGDGSGLSGIDATRIVSGLSSVTVASSSTISAYVNGSNIFNVTGTGVTMTSGKRLDVSSYSENVNFLGSVSGSTALDVGIYSVFVADISGTTSVTFTLSGAVSGRLSSATLILRFSGSASRSVSLAFNPKYVGGGGPTYSTTAVTDIISLFTADAGTTTYVSVVGQGFA